MIPQPREFQAGNRKLIIRLNLGNVVTATRRLRPLLAAHGITNIFGPGSETLMAAAAGGSETLSSVEAEAILGCVCLIENDPPLGIDEYVALVDEYPALADEVAAEIVDFFRRRGGSMLGAVATFRGMMMKIVASLTNLDLAKLEMLLSTGPDSEPPPLSTGESAKTNSGDVPPAISLPSSTDSGPAYPKAEE